MKRILLLTFLIIISTIPVCIASSWKFIDTDSDHAMHYIDVDSIRYVYEQNTGFNNDVILYWSKVYSPPNQFSGFMLNYNKMSISKRAVSLLHTEFFNIVGEKTGEYDLNNNLSLVNDSISSKEYDFLVEYCKNNDELIKSNENKPIMIDKVFTLK